VAVAFDGAGHQDAGERLGGRQLQVRVVLVVPQQDVVARRAGLDEVVLEGQRLHDRVGDDDGQAGDVVEERVGLGARSVGAQIAADAVAQAARLADVDRLAGSVGVEIHPRLLRQSRDLFLEVVDRHETATNRRLTIVRGSGGRRHCPFGQVSRLRLARGSTTLKWPT
jgi:hypothetical protein